MQQGDLFFLSLLIGHIENLKLQFHYFANATFKQQNSSHKLYQKYSNKRIPLKKNTLLETPKSKRNKYRAEFEIQISKSQFKLQREKKELPQLQA